MLKMIQCKAALWLFVFLFLSGILLFETGCDTNPEIGEDGIELGWYVCDYPLGEEKFLNYDCTVLTAIDVSVVGMPDISCNRDEGAFTCLGVPKNSEISLSFKSDEYVSLLVPVKTGNRNYYPGKSNDPVDIAFLAPPMFKISAAKELKNTDAGDGCEKVDDYIPPEPDSQKGEITAIVLMDNTEINEKQDDGGQRDGGQKDGGHEDDGGGEATYQTINGTIVTITKADSEEIIHPIYTEARGIPCYYGPTQDENKGIKNDGYALFNGLDPGNYNVMFKLPEPENGNYFCIVANVRKDRTAWGYRTEKANQIQVPVEAGHSTITILLCYETD